LHLHYSGIPRPDIVMLPSDFSSDEVERYNSLVKLSYVLTYATGQTGLEWITELCDIALQMVIVHLVALIALAAFGSEIPNHIVI
jgi:hypothetical protein